MIAEKSVSVSRGAFRFCRYTMAALMWMGVVWKMEAAIVVGAVIMALSALLSVRRAPLILLYTHTVNRLFPSPEEVVDERALRFAHTMATLAMGIPVALVHYSGSPEIVERAWRFLFWVAVLKTAGALGFCGVSRMYSCLTGGGSCCGLALVRRRAKG